MHVFISISKIFLNIAILSTLTILSFSSGCFLYSAIRTSHHMIFFIRHNTRLFISHIMGSSFLYSGFLNNDILSILIRQNVTFLSLNLHTTFLNTRTLKILRILRILQILQTPPPHAPRWQRVEARWRQADVAAELAADLANASDFGR
mmetsp:Transcript_23220/g.38819  ORF Transcript_23220/g.38819 Transcript_23220/m.38819 type:complete len:148 (+) Transcript_23220:569-1012(+)